MGKPKMWIPRAGEKINFNAVKASHRILGRFPADFQPAYDNYVGNLPARHITGRTPTTQIMLDANQLKEYLKNANGVLFTIGQGPAGDLKIAIQSVKVADDGTFAIDTSNVWSNYSKNDPTFPIGGVPAP